MKNLRSCLDFYTVLYVKDYFILRPEEGVSGLAKFKFYCTSWRSKHRPLHYDIFYKVVSNDLILWYSGKDSGSTSNNLPVGDPLDRYKVKIQFRITNLYGGYATTNDTFVYVSKNSFTNMIYN